MQTAREVVTVLVVEDDWLIREDIVTDLQPEGFAVLEAATGVGALQALRAAGKSSDYRYRTGRRPDRVGCRGSVPDLAPRGAGDLCIGKPCKRSSPSRRECLSQ